MDLTVTQQGMFNATGNAIILPLRGGVDWMRVYNYTASNFVSGAGPASAGKVYNWFSGMAPGDGFVSQNNAGATADLLTTSAALAVGGFTFLDSSLQVPGPSIAYSAGTNATPPVITVVSTAALSTGNIVRITTSATANNASGIDYSIEVLSPTTFSLRNMSAPGSVFGAGTFRVIAFDPIFYPRDRIIGNITPGLTTVISTTVDHGYLPGDLVRLSFPGGSNAPALWGNYGVLDQQIFTVLSVTPASAGVAASFVINANTTGFGAFVWPVVANVPFSYPQVFAFGYYVDSTVPTVPAYPSTNPNQLFDATINKAFIGMQLAAGANSPGGQSAAQSGRAAADVIFWQAGTCFSVNTIQPLALADL